LADGFSCTTDDKTFGAFVFNGTLSTLPGGITVSSSEITVVPIATPGNPGFAFNFDLNAGTGEIAGFSLNYAANVSPQGNPIGKFSASQVGTGGGLTGDVGLSATLSNGATLGLDSHGLDTRSIMFDPVRDLAVDERFAVQGGGRGFATASSLINQFGEVSIPEPKSLAMLLTGILGLIGGMRWRRR